MSRVEAKDMPEYASDGAFRKAVNEYKNLCTIRRDLRTADQICSYIINLHNAIKSEGRRLHQVADTLFLVRASAMHAIVLYGRWFKETTGKTKLSPEKFFSTSSKEGAVHQAIIDHRDKYVAHNQLDLLGSDRVWVNTDANNQFVATDSDFIQQLWPQDSKSLDMEGFQRCIHIVHNKIDSELIPEAQRKLDRLCTILCRKRT